MDVDVGADAGGEFLVVEVGAVGGLDGANPGGVFGGEAKGEVVSGEHACGVIEGDDFECSSGAVAAFFTSEAKRALQEAGRIRLCARLR